MRFLAVCFFGIFLYLIGSAIAWDLDPSNWWSLGRLLLVAWWVVAVFEALTKEDK